MRDEVWGSILITRVVCIVRCSLRYQSGLEMGGINKSQENEEQEMACIAFPHTLHVNTASKLKNAFTISVVLLSRV